MKYKRRKPLPRGMCRRPSKAKHLKRQARPRGKSDAHKLPGYRNRRNPHSCRGWR